MGTVTSLSRSGPGVAGQGPGVAGQGPGVADQCPALLVLHVEHGSSLSCRDLVSRCTPVSSAAAPARRIGATTQTPGRRLPKHRGAATQVPARNTQLAAS